MAGMNGRRRGVFRGTHVVYTNVGENASSHHSTSIGCTMMSLYSRVACYKTTRFLQGGWGWC